MKVIIKYTIGKYTIGLEDDYCLVLRDSFNNYIYTELYYKMPDCLKMYFYYGKNIKKNVIVHLIRKFAISKVATKIHIGNRD